MLSLSLRAPISYACMGVSEEERKSKRKEKYWGHKLRPLITPALPRAGHVFTLTLSPSLIAAGWLINSYHDQARERGHHHHLIIMMRSKCCAMLVYRFWPFLAVSGQEWPNFGWAGLAPSTSFLPSPCRFVCQSFDCQIGRNTHTDLVHPSIVIKRLSTRLTHIRMMMV